MSARNEIIANNMKLVYHLVNKSDYDNSDDNYQTGFVGLIKAVDTFDYTKGYKFSTYASRCILNELAMFYRSNNKEKASLDLDVAVNKEGKTLVSFLPSEGNVADDVSDKSFITVLMRLVINTGDDRDKFILRKYFGFDGKAYNMSEIADMVGINKSGISRIVSYYLGIFRDYVKELGEGEPLSLYDRFSGVSSFKIDYLVSLLSDDKRCIALKRLDGSYGCLSESEIVSFYVDILPYLEKKVSKGDTERRLFKRVRRDKAALVCLMDICKKGDDVHYLEGVCASILGTDSYRASLCDSAIAPDVSDDNKNMALLCLRGAKNFISELIKRGLDEDVLDLYYNKLRSNYQISEMLGKDLSYVNGVIKDSLEMQDAVICELCAGDKYYKRLN